MTAKEHLAVHDREIKAIRELMREGMWIVIQTRQEARTSALRMNRIEAALEMHIRGKWSNGKGESDAR